MTSKSVSTLLVVLIMIFTFPLWIGIIGAVFGIVAGIFGAVAGVIGGIFGAVFGGMGWMMDHMFHTPFGLWHHGFVGWNVFTWLAVALILALILSKSRRK